MIKKGDYVKLLYNCKDPTGGPYDPLKLVALKGDICVVEDYYSGAVHLRVVKTGAFVGNVAEDTVEVLTPLERLALAADDS